MEIRAFFEIYRNIQSVWGKQVYDFIDYCGLEPVIPIERNYYSCTPKNSITFAATGGNGVHFSIIDGIDENAYGPVVMTVPMADINNIVIAESIQEFLSLGCCAGWFSLEQIAYNLDKTIDFYSKNNFKLSYNEERFLSLVKEYFKISWTPLSQHRLDELKERFLHQLRIEGV